jgi:hypothetical protein
MLNLPGPDTTWGEDPPPVAKNIVGFFYSTTILDNRILIKPGLLFQEGWFYYKGIPIFWRGD